MGPDGCCPGCRVGDKCAERVHQAEDEGDEVVGHLGLGDRGGPQSDDRQDAEQAHPEGQPGIRPGQQGDRAEDAEVQHDVGQGEIGLAVTRSVHREHEDGDDDDVDA